ncbi:MAG TPA: M48 family metalloprotease [Pyrinomonadaceae bacterium]|jgi:predicted Zn-dependent protease
MNFSRPPACYATLSLVVYLALSTVAVFAAGASEAERVRVEAYRANLLTPDEERVVGQRLAYLYEQRHKLLKDADTQARLDRITARLRAVIPAQALEIKIIRGTQPEAVSFPTGSIYITSALVKLTTTDDELAAVIAHEAAHVADHHLSRLIALTLALPVGEQELFPSRQAIITGQALQFAFPSTLDNARLRCEMEADQMAVRWLERAGYEGKALALLLDSLTARISPQVQQERAALYTRIALLREQPFINAGLRP